MGLSIEETEVDFRLDRQLTQEELMQTLQYCHHDVEATEAMFNLRKNWAESKLSLINVNRWPLNYISKTNAQMTALTLGATKKPTLYHDEYVYDVPQDLNLGKYSNLLNYFTTPLPEKIELTQIIGGVECKFGVGGLHGALPKYSIAEDDDRLYFFIDVTAYYPSMMINRNYLSRNIDDDKKDNYANIWRIRNEAKKSGDKDKALAYKAVIVTTYGAMDNKYNNLYDPKMRKHVSITGQLFLVDLIDKVEPYSQLIQANTDGICVAVEKEKLPQLQAAVKEWEERTGFGMDWDQVVSFYQKDVNNYFAKLDNGSIKVKGGYLKQSDKESFDGFSRNHLRIIDLTLNAYFASNCTLDVREFISNHKQASDFQMVAKATRVFDGGIVEYKNGEIIGQHGRLARVFATTNDAHGELFKLKNGSPNKVPGLPSKSFIWNKDMNDLVFEDIQLDYDFYINLTINRIADFGLNYNEGRTHAN